MRSWSDKELTEAVHKSNNMCEVLSKIGIRFGGGSFQMVKKHILRLKLDISHFKRKPRPITGYPIDKIFIEHCKMGSSAFRRKFLKLKIIPYTCEKCNNKGEHLGRPLSLQLDHKNGIHDDNRIENLRWLCPNCHSQTDTYARIKGKILLFTERQPNFQCDGCGAPVWRKPSMIKSRRDQGYKTYCTHECSVIHRKAKIEWPDTDMLNEMISKYGYQRTGKELGVSDKAVKKHVNKLKLFIHMNGAANPS